MGDYILKLRGGQTLIVDLTTLQPFRLISNYINKYNLLPGSVIDARSYDPDDLIILFSGISIDNLTPDQLIKIYHLSKQLDNNSLNTQLYHRVMCVMNEICP